MGNKQSKGTLKQGPNKSHEKTKTIQGEANPIEEEAKIHKLQTTTLDILKQTNQEEVNTSKEIKGEESKDTNIEEMTSDQLYEQILNIEFLFNNSAQINGAMKKQREDQVFEFIRQMKSSSLIDTLKGKEQDIFTERMLNANKIINKIFNSFENLKC